jgi:hypothetical protein
LSGWLQHAEEMWAPLGVAPAVYSDSEKIDVVRDGIMAGKSRYGDRLENALDYGRSGNMTYEQTKSHLLRTMNWIINDEGKKIPVELPPSLVNWGLLERNHKENVIDARDLDTMPEIVLL